MEQKIIKYLLSKDKIKMTSYYALFACLVYIAYLFITEKPVGVITFFIITILSHLFFLMIIPLEGLFYILIKNSEINPYLFLILLSACATLSFYINYKIGEKIPKKAFHSYLGTKRYNKYKLCYDKYGYLYLFIAASTPCLPGPILSFLSGFFKEDLKKTMIVSFIGLLIKWILFYIIFEKSLYII